MHLCYSLKSVNQPIQGVSSLDHSGDNIVCFMFSSSYIVWTGSRQILDRLIEFGNERVNFIDCDVMYRRFDEMTNNTLSFAHHRRFSTDMIDVDLFGNSNMSSLNDSSLCGLSSIPTTSTAMNGSSLLSHPSNSQQQSRRRAMTSTLATSTFDGDDFFMDYGNEFSQEPLFSNRKNSISLDPLDSFGTSYGMRSSVDIPMYSTKPTLSRNAPFDSQFDSRFDTPYDNQFESPYDMPFDAQHLSVKYPVQSQSQSPSHKPSQFQLPNPGLDTSGEGSLDELGSHRSMTIGRSLSDVNSASLDNYDFTNSALFKNYSTNAPVQSKFI